VKRDEMAENEGVERRPIPPEYQTMYDAAAQIRKPLPRGFDPRPDDLEPEFLMAKPLEHQLIDAVENAYAGTYVCEDLHLI
jgi:hypothetical protein